MQDHDTTALPRSEADRLRELCSLKLLDVQREQRFQRYTELASDILTAPISLIIDGTWDAQAQHALIEFQQAQGLEPIGELDHQTLAALELDAATGERAAIGITGDTGTGGDDDVGIPVSGGIGAEPRPAGDPGAPEVGDTGEDAQAEAGQGDDTASE